MIGSSPAIDPAREALVDGPTRLTYAELLRESDQLAGALLALGLAAGQPVAIVLPNGAPFVLGSLALARQGALAMTLAHDSAPDELSAALAASGCRWAIVDARHQPWAQAARAAGLLDVVIGVACEEALGFEQLLAGDPAPPASVDPDQPALLQVTSGTTGRPKRIRRSHAQLLAEARSFGASAATGPEDRVLGVVPFSHAHGYSNAMMAALHAGGCLITLHSFDRRALLRALASERVSLFPAVPFMLSVIADTRMPEPVDLTSLRLCFTAGAPLPEATCERVRERLGITVRQLYGSTETGALTLNVDANPQPSRRSVGRPLAGVELRVVPDPDGDDDLGEVQVRSAGAASQVDEGAGWQPLADAEGWIAMGDQGRLDEAGRLWVHGRRALLINVSGRKVHPVEIEQALLAHPGVRDAVALPYTDPYGEEAIRAVIVRSTRPCTAEQLQAHCAERLAGYKVPRRFEFRDAIPRCPAGKVLRSQLQAEPATR